MIELNLIVAVSSNGIIGLPSGSLPWNIPADLQHFKNLTTSYPIVMGRNTYDSIGKPLPNRDNIIVTRMNQKEFISKYGVVSSLYCRNSLVDAITLGNEFICVDDRPKNDRKVFIIGGAEIYRIALESTIRIDNIYITEVDIEIPEEDGVARFEFLSDGYEQEVLESHAAKDGCPSFRFLKYTKQ